jgi:hypothetical protein
MPRQCIFRKGNGEPCRAAPLRDGDQCLMHSPEHAKEMAEARRLGGMRRKREVTVAGAYDIGSLDNVGEIRRLIQIAVFDTLGLENSISRSRTLGYLAGVATKLLEVGELEQRLSMLEQAVLGKAANPERVFDVEPKAMDFPSEEEAAD